jgi:hypothetical protein
MFKNIRSLMALMLLVVFAISCGDDSNSPSNSTDYSDPKYEAEYSDQAVIIDENNTDALIKSDTANDVYMFDPNKLPRELQVGDVVVVSGELMKKVTKINNIGGNIEIEAEDAKLTDVITNGEITMDIQPEWEDVTGITIDGDEINVKNNDRTLTEISHSVTYGDITHNISIKPKTGADGKITSATFKFVMVKKSGSNATASFTAEGTVNLPKQQSSIVIKNSELQAFKSDNKGMYCDLELSLAAAGGKSGSHSFKLPEIALKIPIKYIPTPSGPIPIPIPISIDVGIQFVTQLSIGSANASATASGKARISSEGGFEYKGSSVETKATIGDHDISDGEFDSAAGIGIPVDAQFGVAFPRVSLNIASQEVAYIHTGFTMGSTLTWGPLCKKGYVKLLVEGGYKLSVLGKELYNEKKTFAEKQKEAKGEGCE